MPLQREANNTTPAHFVTRAHSRTHTPTQPLTRLVLLCQSHGVPF
jgi:hypothetical protein